MKRLLAFVIAAILLACCAGDRLRAQQPVITLPYTGGLTSNMSSTVAVTNTFQSVFAAPDLTKNQKRSACTIQNNTATGANAMYVFFGPIANATTANSVKLSQGQPVNCNVGGITLQDQVSITGTSGDAYYAAQQ